MKFRPRLPYAQSRIVASMTFMTKSVKDSVAIVEPAKPKVATVLPMPTARGAFQTFRELLGLSRPQNPSRPYERNGTPEKARRKRGDKHKRGFHAHRLDGVLIQVPRHASSEIRTVAQFNALRPA